MLSINKVVLTVVLVVLTVVLAFAVYGVRKLSMANAGEQDLRLERTMIDIEAVRPRGELYVGTAIIEDYVNRYETEFHFGLVPEPHNCIQMLRQKCSYVIDLDLVNYVSDTPGVVIVQLPELSYIASTQDSPFMSDDEDYWAEALPSTNDLKREVEQKIRERFDTPESRQKALRNAEASISLLLRKLGYEARFAPRIESEKL